MKKSLVCTLIRWINRNGEQLKVNEYQLFQQALLKQCQEQNPWRVQRCIDAYFAKGTVPDFVADFVRIELYPELYFAGKP